MGVRATGGVGLSAGRGAVDTRVCMGLERGLLGTELGPELDADSGAPGRWMDLTGGATCAGATCDGATCDGATCAGVPFAGESLAAGFCAGEAGCTGETGGICATGGGSGVGGGAVTGREGNGEMGS